MLKNQCTYLLPRFGPNIDFAILDGACLLRDDHGTDDHLVCLFNPILYPEFIIWTPDRINNDGSDDYEDYVYADITRREAKELLIGSWGNEQVQHMVHLIESVTVK